MPFLNWWLSDASKAISPAAPDQVFLLRWISWKCHRTPSPQDWKFTIHRTSLALLFTCSFLQKIKKFNKMPELSSRSCFLLFWIHDGLGIFNASGTKIRLAAFWPNYPLILHFSCLNLPATDSELVEQIPKMFAMCVDTFHFFLMIVFSLQTFKTQTTPSVHKWSMFVAKNTELGISKRTGQVFIVLQ